MGFVLKGCCWRAARLRVRGKGKGGLRLARPNGPTPRSDYARPALSSFPAHLNHPHTAPARRIPPSFTRYTIGALIMLNVLLDWVDGPVARSYGQSSIIG
jgi:phosphatidylglycerophosphate synthase